MTATTSTEPKVPAPRGGSAGAADGRERVSAFWSLSRAMLLGMKRDRTATFFILLFPLVFLVFFGSVTKGNNSPHAKVAQVGAVKLFDSMQGEGRTELDKVLTITRTDDEAGTLEKVRKGDFDAMITQGPDGKVELRYSAADTVRAGALQGIVNSVVQEANQAATKQPPTYVVDAQQVEDKSLKPIQFLTPGLLGWAVATGAVFGAALTLVNWRRSKVLRRLRLAPISAGTVVSSRIVVSLLTAFLQTTVFLVVATSFFGLKLTGDWWLVLPLVACATLAFMSIGLLAGSVAKTEEAASGISQLIVLPMSFLSGSFFPLDGAPGWLKTVSEIMPLKYLVSAAQSVLTRGGGVMDALPAMGGLLLFAAVCTGISWKLFRWEDA
ncbi:MULTISPECIES: ABC transporter permease [Kitasatospora]|uniref:ABC transporter permease n=1 Tax=Kitasatospora cathayae TaxID=3004092 RepID=A0ABY7Q1W8_9ACTN|nr:ABC transporter permease [Kitasatospora sp. HUAS 3-15]WBP86668.1 ABC transporter permease [Kitasatospora sp. HUAS 3-15]